LPAAIVNGKGDRLEKCNFLNFRSLGVDVDLVSCITAYRRASLIDLYLHTKFCWNRKNLWTDGRTDVWMCVRMYLLTDISHPS